MSDYDRPFLEDGSQFGISRDGFEQMDQDEQREWMLAWFHHNFEDPQNQTPYDSDTKGYMYLWGGPYDAKEQLWEKFGDIVPEALIDDVAEEIGRDGTADWAPAPNSPFYDDGRDDEDEEQPEPPSLDIYLDEPSDRYGSPEEREARARAREAIEELRRALERPRIIGIGHNRPPPEEEKEPEGIKELRPALQELSTELAKPNPDIALVKRWATPLRDALVATAKWSAKKIDIALDEAAKTAGQAIGVGVVSIVGLHYYPAMVTAFEAVTNWLEIAAKALF